MDNRGKREVVIAVGSPKWIKRESQSEVYTSLFYFWLDLTSDEVLGFWLIVAALSWCLFFSRANVNCSYPCIFHLSDKSCNSFSSSDKSEAHSWWDYVKKEYKMKLPSHSISSKVRKLNRYSPKWRKVFKPFS